MSRSQEDEAAIPQRLGLREFRGNMAGLLRQAQVGHSFLIRSRDQMLAEIHPPARPVRSQRQPGALRGKIRMPLDLVALPQDMRAAMSGG